jgi:hypothetical protein
VIAHALLRLRILGREQRSRFPATLRCSCPAQAGRINQTGASPGATRSVVPEAGGSCRSCRQEIGGRIL